MINWHIKGLSKCKVGEVRREMINWKIEMFSKSKVRD